MLTYDDAAHTYRLDGRRIPSVTQALKLAGHIDASFYTPEAAARGTLIHAACESIDTGWDTERNLQRARVAAAGLGISDADISPYIEAYENFLSDTRIEYEYQGIERLCVHPSGLYGCRPDRLVMNLFDERGVLELKSGDEADWHGYQLALYQLARPAGARWAVYLQKTGKYRLVRALRADDYRVGRQAIGQAWAALTVENVQI